MKPDSLKALLEVVNQPRSRVSASPGFASVDLLFWSSYPWGFLCLFWWNGFFVGVFGLSVCISKNNQWFDGRQRVFTLPLSRILGCLVGLWPWDWWYHLFSLLARVLFVTVEVTFVAETNRDGTLHGTLRLDLQFFVHCLTEHACYLSECLSSQLYKMTGCSSCYNSSTVFDIYFYLF